MCVGGAAAHVRLTYGVFDPEQDETLTIVIHAPSRAADRVSDARSPESRDLGLILLSCLHFPGCVFRLRAERCVRCIDWTAFWSLRLQGELVQQEARMCRLWVLSSILQYSRKSLHHKPTTRSQSAGVRRRSSTTVVQGVTSQVARRPEHKSNALVRSSCTSICTLALRPASTTFKRHNRVAVHSTVVLLTDSLSMLSTAHAWPTACAQGTA
jgi:hypothetical protein